MGTPVALILARVTVILKIDHTFFIYRCEIYYILPDQTDPIDLNNKTGSHSLMKSSPIHVDDESGHSYIHPTILSKQLFDSDWQSS